MIIALLKNRNDTAHLTFQQKHILKYAHQHDLLIDSTEIENSDRLLELEKRKEFKGFLRSLSSFDQIIIYDITTFSDHVDELVKVFECLLTRSISIHIVEPNLCISTESKLLVLLDLLVKQREFNKNTEKEKSQGRPKGRMSKSKFDTHRSYIIELIEKDICVSDIAKILNVSRTSLKDYIHSRGLKELVKAKLALLQPIEKQPLVIKPLVTKECSLIKQPIDHL